MSKTETKPNETSQNKAKQNGAKADRDEQVNGRLPFTEQEVFGWIKTGIAQSYGVTIDIKDFGKTRNTEGMIDIIGQMVKKEVEIETVDAA